MALRYLGLPPDYKPSPEEHPIDFLSEHLSQLPPHILHQFTNTTTPKQRTVIPTIRNRRLKYTSQVPKELGFEAAVIKWPQLWTGVGRQEGKDEKDWANHQFLDGQHQHVGKLGVLLGDYEEEREAERVRSLRHRVVNEFIPEEDESESDGEPAIPEEETEEEARANFERVIRERFIYGLLEEIDYDHVDWDESLDTEEDREAEERWFDEDV